MRKLIDPTKRGFYKHHGQKQLILPEKKIELPSKEFLR